MNNNFSVSLESPQSGWMSLRLRAGAESFVAVMSHAPYDSLRELIEGLTALVAGGRGFTVKWNAEPEEYDFEFEPAGAEVELRVARYAGRRRAGDLPSVVFAHRGPRAEVCQSFWREFKRLRDRRETDVYEQNWRRAFPERELRDFTQALKHSRQRAAGSGQQEEV